MKAKKYQGGGKMNEMKKKTPSRIHTSKASRDRESYKRDVREGYAPLPFAGGLPKRMTDAEDIAATKKEREKGKRLRYDNGGKVTGAKTEKSRAGKSYVLREGKKLIEKRDQEQLERSVRESNRAKRINESEARRAKARPDYRPKKKVEEGLRDDDGRILSANKLGRKDVTKLEMTSPKKEIQKSTAKIPVPAKKRRLRRK